MTGPSLDVRRHAHRQANGPPARVVPEARDTGAVLRTVAGVVGAVVIIGAALVGLLWVFQRHLIFLPSTEPVPPAASVIPVRATSR
jgi:hypothetical protein